MRDVKLVNGLLWAMNGLLGLGLLAFTWFFLIKDGQTLRKYPWEDDAAQVAAQTGSKGDDGVLKTLPNPVEKRTEAAATSGPSAFRATLKGTLASEKEPKSGIAFLKSIARNVECVAYVGEEIREGDKPFDEFRGWKLVEVGKTHALFSNGAQQATLTLDLSSPSPAGAPGGGPTSGGGPGARGNKIGQPYQSGNFKSTVLSSTENRVVWGLDQDEIDWAFQNQDSIMDQAVQVSPSAAGGIRIDSVQAGSIGATRGLMAGDVIKEVNGQPLGSVADVKTLMTGPAMRAQTGMRITIERAGKPVVVEYRPLPR